MIGLIPRLPGMKSGIETAAAGECCVRANACTTSSPLVSEEGAHMHNKLTTSFFIFLQSLTISRTPRTFIFRESLLEGGRKLEGELDGGGMGGGERGGDGGGVRN